MTGENLRKGLAFSENEGLMRFDLEQTFELYFEMGDCTKI